MSESESNSESRVKAVLNDDLLAFLAPVLDWYQSDEHPERPPLDILRDIVADLQTDRAQNLNSAATLANYRRFVGCACLGFGHLVGKLATAKNKNEAWSIAKCWAPEEFWRSIGFALATDEERQAFIFG